MRARLLILGFLAAVFVGGCEDVVQVELNSTEPKLVIEGHLSNESNYCYFRVNRTTDYFNPRNSIDGVTGALIVVSDNSGSEDTLGEHTPGTGYYFFPREFSAVAGKTYSATVILENRTFTANTTMVDQVRVDSMTFEYEEDNRFVDEGEEEDGYRLHVFFQDTPGKPDYARIKLTKERPFNYDIAYYDIFLYDGRLSDGNTVDYNYFFKVFQLGERAEVELISMDKAMYDYFLTLREVAVVLEGNLFDVTPANPNTNWSGGALGYFGAFNSSYAYKVVEPE